MRIFVVLMILGLFTGCGNVERSPLMQGKTLIRPGRISPRKKNGDSPAGRKYNLSANGMMMRDFCSWLSRSSGFGVVFSQSLDGLSVSLDFRDATIEEIMMMFSRRYGVSAIRSGNTYFIGQSRGSDRYIYVRAISGYSVEDVRSVVGLFGIDNSKSVVMSNGVCVFLLDNDSVVKTISALDTLCGLAPSCYLVSVYLVRRRNDFNLGGGLNFVPEGSVSAYLSSISGRVGLVGSPEVSLDAVIGFVDADWRFVCYCGRKTSVNSGSELRVSRRDVSQYGVSSSSGADVIQCGLTLDFTLNMGSRGELTAEYNIVDRRLDSWRDGYPQTYSQVFNGVSACWMGGACLLGDFVVRDRSVGLRALLVPFVGYGYSRYYIIASVAPYSGGD